MALDPSEDKDLAGPTPTAFAVPGAAKGRLIALHRPTERLPQLFGGGAAGPQRSMKPFPRRCADIAAEALAVRRHSQNEHLEKLVFWSRLSAAPNPTPTSS